MLSCNQCEPIVTSGEREGSAEKGCYPQTPGEENVSKMKNGETGQMVSPRASREFLEKIDGNYPIGFRESFAKFLSLRV